MPANFYPHRARRVAAQLAAPPVFTSRFIIWCFAIAVVAAAVGSVW